LGADVRQHVIRVSLCTLLVACGVVAACGGRIEPIAPDEDASPPAAACIASDAGAPPACATNDVKLECLTSDEMLSLWTLHHPTTETPSFDACSCITLASHFTDECCADAVSDAFYFGAKCCYYF
jgi:hypothetical protein